MQCVLGPRSSAGRVAVTQRRLAESGSVWPVGFLTRGVQRLSGAVRDAAEGILAFDGAPVRSFLRPFRCWASVAP